MDCKTPYIKIFLWLFLFFQKVDFKFTTQEKHENITFLGITFLSDHLQKWQTPFWNRLNELHLIISFVCHKQLVLYHKKNITCLGQIKVLCLPAVCLLLPLRDTWYNHLEYSCEPNHYMNMSRNHNKQECDMQLCEYKQYTAVEPASLSINKNTTWL